MASVLNTVQMPMPLAPRFLSRHDITDGPVVATATNTSSIGNIKAAAGSTTIQPLAKGYITPAKLTAGYNIDSNAASASATQAVFACPTGSNGWNYFSKSDLKTFQTTFGLQSSAVAKFMTIGHPSTNDDTLPVITTYYSGANIEVCKKVRATVDHA